MVPPPGSGAKALSALVAAGRGWGTRVALCCVVQASLESSSSPSEKQQQFSSPPSAEVGKKKVNGITRLGLVLK